MPCSGRYATAVQYNNLLCAGLDFTVPGVQAQVEAILDIAASDVHGALAAVGACNCTIASWATVYLAKLNVIDAAAIHSCPCARKYEPEEKQMWIDWLNNQFELIRTGQIVVCEGETGSKYPAVGWGEYSFTEWNEAQIIINQNIKTP